MKRKVKYKNFERSLTVVLLGDYSQNVPKPKCTQVKMYLRGVKIFSSEVKTYPCGVKMYPLCICITSICVQINRNYVFIILKIFNSALFWICLTWLKPQGLETYFNMHKYTELLTFLTKIRISEYKHIQRFWFLSEMSII